MTVPTDSDHSRETVIVNRRGLHARAAAKVAALAEEFDAEIIVAANGVSATARSIWASCCWPRDPEILSG